MRHAIINKDTLKVVNIVIWEGHPWLPPHEHIVVQEDKANIGDIYDPVNNTFSMPASRIAK